MAGERRAALAKAAELLEQKRLLVSEGGLPLSRDFSLELANTNIYFTNTPIMDSSQRRQLIHPLSPVPCLLVKVREVKALRRSLAEASSVNRSLARAYESLDHSLRTSSSITSTTVTNEDTSAEMENRGSLNSAPGTSAAGSTLPPPPSPPGSSVGSLGGVDEWRDWRETRLSISSQQGGGAGGVGPGRGNGREENEEAVAVPGFQFRNLSTGDVDVFDPAGGVGGVKERAATDDSGGQTADSRVSDIRML